MASLVDALTLAYDETETRPSRGSVGLSLVLVLASAMVLGGLLAGGGLATRALSGAPREVVETAGVLAWVVLAVPRWSSRSGVLYRVAPDRRLARWRWVSPGASRGHPAVAARVGRAVRLRARSRGTYETTYGSLAGVAISMLWLWLTVLLVLVGAVLNAEAERQTGRDSTVGPERPPGERGAVVADSLAR